jgi:hypothetical protein
MLRIYEKHNLASKSFLFNKETQVEIFFESVFGKSKCDCRWSHFDMIAASLSDILIWTSTCGSVRYKRKIQNRKIQSKRVLGLTKYTHWLADHNKVTQEDFFVETAHRKSRGVLILRTISRHKPISHQNQKTGITDQVYCTLSTYVIPKTISCQNQKTNTMTQLYCILDT